MFFFFNNSRVSRTATLIDLIRVKCYTRRTVLVSFFSRPITNLVTQLTLPGCVTRLLVGAPRAQTEQPGVVRGGAVFRCYTDAADRCEAIPFDENRKLRSARAVVRSVSNPKRDGMRLLFPRSRNAPRFESRSGLAINPLTIARIGAHLWHVDHLLRGSIGRPISRS